MAPVRTFVVCWLFAISASAQSAAEVAQRAQVESLRAEVANQIQLQAFDLLDELIYRWSKEAPFSSPTPVMLAGVSAPVGFGSGLQGLLENHVASLLIKNPSANIELSHCPQCSAWMVQSGAKGTLIARGFDNPDALAKAGAVSGAKHALFLDFEAEGAALVLRARITSIDKPSLPIVAAKTLSTTTGAPALLRQPDRLKSSQEARQEYLDALRERSLISVPLRVGIRTYAEPLDQSVGMMTSPFLWLMVGAELAFSQARAWTASLNAGASWAPQAHFALSGQARFSRLLTGSTTSLTMPDLYVFFGGGVQYVQGPSALIFRDQTPTVGDILAASTGNDSHTVLGTMSVGFELRVKNRIGINVYLETFPGLQNTRNIGSYFWPFGTIKFQAIGVEVSFWL